MQAEHDSKSAYAGIWREVTARVAFEIPDEAKRYLEAMRFLSDISDAGGLHRLRKEREKVDEAAEEESEVDELVRRLVDHVRGLADAALIAQEPPVKAVPPDSGQWRLVTDLLRQHEETIGYPSRSHWAPVEAGSDPGFRINDLGAFGGRRVLLRFDGRLSLHALTSELRKMWPELRRQGLVRRTKPLSDRSVALLRLVCLECSRDDRWDARWEAWELRYGARWHYASRRAFNSDFHRAERQLTGHAKGLAPFYEQKAWVAARPAGDVLALARPGDMDARALLDESARQVAAALSGAAERMHLIAGNDEDTPQR